MVDGASAAVMDQRGVLLSAATDTSAGLLRPFIAQGKANAALGMNMHSADVEAIARERPYFKQTMVVEGVGPGVPVQGAVLIQDATGHTVGAVGISGGTSKQDEEAALAALEICRERHGKTV